MFGRLDASNFNGSTLFYQGEFELILSKVTACYQMMITENVQVPNNENKIRDKLLIDYLRNPLILKSISMPEVLFDRETLEDHSVGRIDIRVISPETFKEPKAYFILECKKLDNKNPNGSSGLNAEYIKNGILRLTSKFYSSFYRTNGMIGFVVAPLDIHANIECINTLLETPFKAANTNRKITKENFIDGFEYHYSSLHSDLNSDPLIIYHLMFDFSKNISN